MKKIWPEENLQDVTGEQYRSTSTCRERHPEWQRVFKADFSRNEASSLFTNAKQQWHKSLFSHFSYRFGDQRQELQVLLRHSSVFSFGKRKILVEEKSNLMELCSSKSSLLSRPPDSSPMSINQWIPWEYERISSNFDGFSSEEKIFSTNSNWIQATRRRWTKIDPPNFVWLFLGVSQDERRQKTRLVLLLYKYNVWKEKFVTLFELIKSRKEKCHSPWPSATKRVRPLSFIHNDCDNIVQPIIDIRTR